MTQCVHLYELKIIKDVERWVCRVPGCDHISPCLPLPPQEQLLKENEKLKEENARFKDILSHWD